MTEFSTRVLDWFAIHGRTGLPWQQDINAYRVWVSEIMLQQTQVTTAIPYFNAFMERFPTVQDLANASQDEVLHYWSGLGYYSRAKNLHKASLQIINEFEGALPSEQESLESLCGIGRSTAAAIRSIAFEQPAAILDGNVKRVLARHQGISGWPGKTDTLKKLWAAAEALKPIQQPRNYSQAMMDLGATCCTRSRPNCEQCPISSDCFALANNCISELPGKKPKKELPVKSTMFCIFYHGDNILLQKRPITGIWPGLHGFYEIQDSDELPKLLNNLQLVQNNSKSLESFRHTFSHYHLDIAPLLIELVQKPNQVQEGEQLWYNIHHGDKIGIAAPVNRIIQTLKNLL